MDPSGYIKLIEFTYILEGYQILYEYETDKSTSGEMFSTASAIMDEIYQYSWFKRTLTSRTQSSLSQQWRKIIKGEQNLDCNLFKNVLLDIHNVCQEYLLKKYTMQRYSSSRACNLDLDKVSFKQSSLTIDSGVQTLVEPSCSSQSEESVANAKTILMSSENHQKKEKKSKVDKFANLPKELLEKHCKTATNVLEKHINKTFPSLQPANSLSGHSSKGSAPSAGPLKHLNPLPTDDDPILPILQFKLKNLL